MTTTTFFKIARFDDIATVPIVSCDVTSTTALRSTLHPRYLMVIEAYLCFLLLLSLHKTILSVYPKFNRNNADSR